MPGSKRKNFLSSRYYDTAIHAALSALKHGDKITAERLALRAASLDPDADAPWLILASLAGPEESLAYVKKALQINPDSIRVQQAMEWVLGRLHAESQAAEPGQIPEDFPPEIDLAKTPRQIQPAELELEQLPEDLYPEADPTEIPREVRPADVELEQPPEELFPEADLTEIPREVQPVAVEPEQPAEQVPPASSLPSWAEPVPQAAQSAAPETEQPPELPSGPLPSWAEPLPGAVQPEAEKPKPPSGYKSPLDTLPTWIEAAALPHSAAPEPSQPSGYIVEIPGGKVPPFILESEELNDLTANPVESPADAPSSFIAALEQSADHLIRSPVSRIETSPAIVQPIPLVEERKRFSPFLQRTITYVVFILGVAAVITGLMFLLPQVGDLWARLFAGK